MFDTINEPRPPRLLCRGLAVQIPLTALIMATCFYWPRLLALTPRPDAVFVVCRLVKPLKPVRAASQGPRGGARGDERDEAAAKPPATAAPSATVGTAQWRAHAAHGDGLGFDVVAEHSLPILEAYGSLLAIDVQRPCGDTILYDLRKHSLRHGRVPAGAIPRELDLMPAEFDSVRREAERELGGSARFWALYSPDLYNALRSLTEEALRRQAIPISDVRVARVHLALAGASTFAVSLVSHI